MKKIFTFCFFAFILLLTTQTVAAQDAAKVNEAAALKAKELRSQIKFDDNVLGEIYKAYQEYESKSYSIKNHMKSGTSEYKKEKDALEQRLQKAIKNAIGDELYARYLILKKQEKTK